MALEERKDLVGIVSESDHATSFERLEEFVARNPNDAEAHYKLGCVYEKYGVYSGCTLVSKAVKSWRRARNINPDSIEAHGPLIYGDVNERIEKLEKELEQTPDDVCTLSLLGNAYCQKGFETRFAYSKKAVDKLTKALEHDPKHQDANNSRSIIILTISDELNMIKHDFRKVKKGLEACDLNQAEFHYKLGDDCFTKGEYEKAMEEYKKAIFGYHKFQIERITEKTERILSWPIAFLKELFAFPIRIIRGY